jgi:hypothetical protein
MGASNAAKEFRGWHDLEYLFRKRTVTDFDAGITPVNSAAGLSKLFNEATDPLARVALRLWLTDNPQALTDGE